MCITYCDTVMVRCLHHILWQSGICISTGVGLGSCRCSAVVLTCRRPLRAPRLTSIVRRHHTRAIQAGKLVPHNAALITCSSQHAGTQFWSYLEEMARGHHTQKYTSLLRSSGPVGQLHPADASGTGARCSLGPARGGMMHLQGVPLAKLAMHCNSALTSAKKLQLAVRNGGEKCVRVGVPPTVPPTEPTITLHQPQGPLGTGHLVQMLCGLDTCKHVVKFPSSDADILRHNNAPLAAHGAGEGELLAPRGGDCEQVWRACGARRAKQQPGRSFSHPSEVDHQLGSPLPSQPVSQAGSNTVSQAGSNTGSQRHSQPVSHLASWPSRQSLLSLQHSLLRIQQMQDC
jgi:hypothetical protein